MRKARNRREGKAGQGEGGQAGRFSEIGLLSSLKTPWGKASYPQIFPVLIALCAALTSAAGLLPIWQSKSCIRMRTNRRRAKKPARGRAGRKVPGKCSRAQGPVFPIQPAARPAAARSASGDGAGAFMVCLGVEPPGLGQVQGRLSTDFSCFDSALRSVYGSCGRFA